MQHYRMYIDGRHVDPVSGAWFESHNPYTGEPWAEIPRGNAEDVDRAVHAADKAFREGPWPQLTASERGLLRTGEVSIGADEWIADRA